MWLNWLLIAGFFLVLEIFTTGFLVFWFGIAALIALLFSLFIPNIIAQITIFLISSIVLLFLTRKLFNTVTPPTIKTNAFAIEGKTGKVIRDINPTEGTGQVKVGGEVWAAKSYNDEPILKNTEITVEKIDGVKAIVIPIIKV